MEHQLFVSSLAAEGEEKNKNSPDCAASEEFRLVPQDITPVKQAGCNNTSTPKNRSEETLSNIMKNRSKEMTTQIKYENKLRVIAFILL